MSGSPKHSYATLMQEVQQLKSQIGGFEAEVAPARDEFERPDFTAEEDEGGESSADSDLDLAEEEPAITADSDSDSTEKKTEESDQPVSLFARLSRTRDAFFGKITGLFSAGARFDESLYSELEELLIGADLGVKTATGLVADLRQEVSAGGVATEDAAIALLKSRILAILKDNVRDFAGIRPERKEDGPFVVLLVGVNGTGKTTTAAKLSAAWKAQGLKILLVAADTYRAAAVEQLCHWGDRLDIPVHRGVENAKPATVVFDAMEKAMAEAFDVVLVDTAGRLHTKSNLMQELEGVRNVIARKQSSAPHETILVVDGATGQNALSQAREFNESLGLSGVVITKLDGTPRGGVVVAIRSETGVPVDYIGVGESAGDLRPFVAEDFVEALFSSPDAQKDPA